MTHIQVNTDLDRMPWTDIPLDDELLHGAITRIGLLANGTLGGQASLALAVTLDDGRTVVAETTWRVFYVAVLTLAASPVGSQETDHR